MIIDNLKNLEKYVSLNPLYKDVIEFIKTNDLNALPEGKTFIKGDDLFVNIQIAKGKTKEEAVMETHNKMIDIQIPLDTEEEYGYIAREDLPEVEYNAEKDITKYPGIMGICYVKAKPGMFCIFDTQDGHAPCVAPQPIKKAIFKVKA
ncbi:MAG: YhcH/YjgK/YiaL family protein [Bacteroidaceae bacterium]|nr:YhcH/YjgK/YiaL family protein [Bacteroidaceae bacterium]